MKSNLFFKVAAGVLIVLVAGLAIKLVVSNSNKQIKFTMPILAIGDSYQGGIIAYILQPGDSGYSVDVQHGLIAASSDQGTSVKWGCQETAIDGADGTAIGTGNQNTIDIMNGCSEAGIAARLCGDLVLNGYSDWYLPSKDELNKLYIPWVEIGGYTARVYWSSSESHASLAFCTAVYYGLQSTCGKDATYHVCAVRGF